MGEAAITTLMEGKKLGEVVKESSTPGIRCWLDNTNVKLKSQTLLTMFQIEEQCVFT